MNFFISGLHLYALIFRHKLKQLLSWHKNYERIYVAIKRDVMITNLLLARTLYCSQNALRDFPETERWLAPNFPVQLRTR